MVHDGARGPSRPHRERQNTGAGHYQLELTYDCGTDQDADTKIRTQRFNGVLSIGLTDDHDFIISLPHERSTEETGVTKTTISGYADM